MLYYLDTNIVIYAVQAGAPEHQRAIGQLPGHHSRGAAVIVNEAASPKPTGYPIK